MALFPLGDASRLARFAIVAPIEFIGVMFRKRRCAAFFELGIQLMWALRGRPHVRRLRDEVLLPDVDFCGEHTSRYSFSSSWDCSRCAPAKSRSVAMLVITR